MTDWLPGFVRTGMSMGVGALAAWAWIRHGWLGYFAVVAALSAALVVCLALYGLLALIEDMRDSA